MDDTISRQAALDCVTYDVEYTTERIKALPSLQPTCNRLATDCISRKVALDGIDDYLEEYDGIDENGNHDLKWCAMKEAELLIKDLPSVQPTINCSEIPNASDFVSRKAVRDMVATWSYDMAEWEDVELALSDVDKLPSVHPEVIHCKDCALWHRTGCPMNIFVKKPEPGYFCGTAKRKESQCGYERQDVQTEENMQMIDLREEQEERLGAAPILNPKAK